MSVPNIAYLYVSGEFNKKIFADNIGGSFHVRPTNFKVKLTNGEIRRLYAFLRGITVVDYFFKYKTKDIRVEYTKTVRGIEEAFKRHSMEKVSNRQAVTNRRGQLQLFS